MNAPHPDDFTLLVLLEGELSELEAARLRRHLAECPACASACRDIDRLDRTLKRAAPELERALSEPELPPGDPFRCRPDCTRLGRPRPAGAGATSDALAASRAASEVKGRLLSALGAPDEDLRSALSALDLLALRDRYGLGYALDEALYSMVDGPARWERFGLRSSEVVLSARSGGRALDAPAERAYPLEDLLGLSLLVTGTARNWTGEFLRGGRDLRRAYAAFARGSVSERRLASVELAEAQRRAFLDRAAEALASHDRWNTYVSALNGLGTCLMNLGRLEEARREYARALRLVGRDARPAVHAFIRANLARTLFEGKRYAEAARALDEAARHFATQGAKADELTMRLLGVEALARSGEPGRARAMAGDLAAELRSLGAAEPELLESYEAALKGDLPDVDLLETLRSRTQEQISERLRRAG